MIAEWFECIGANYSGNGETLLRNAGPRKCPHCCCCQGIQKRLILWVLCASQLGGVKIPAERWTHPWSPKTCPDPALPLRIVVSQLCNARPLPADITQLCVVYFEIHYLGNLSHISWKLCSILAEEKKDFPNGLAGVLVSVREYWRWTILFPTIISSFRFIKLCNLHSLFGFALSISLPFYLYHCKKELLVEQVKSADKLPAREGCFALPQMSWNRWRKAVPIVSATFGCGFHIAHQIHPTHWHEILATEI